MKFTIDDISELKQALAFAAKAIPARPSHPVLGNFKLVAESDRVTVTTFDLTLSIQVSVPATVVEPGVTCLDKLFGEQVNRQSGKMSFTRKSETEAQIRFAGSKYTARLLDAEQFPELPAIAAPSVPIGDMAANLTKVLYAVSTEDTKGVLQGVHLGDGQIAAADTHRIAVTASVELPSCTIHGEHLKKFAKILTPETTLAVSPQIARFASGSDASSNWSVTTRLLEGQYPNFNQLIPQTFTYAAECDRPLLLGVLDRLSVLAENAFSQVVQLRFLKTEGKLSVFVRTPEHGDGEERIEFEPYQWGDSDFSIHCNYKYLNAAIKAVSSDLVRLQFNTATSPFVVGGDGSTHLVMPVQVRE